MKRLLFFTMVFIFQLHKCMEIIPIAPEQKWRDAFRGLDKKKYNDVVEYDLELELWEDNRKKVIHNNVSLLAHGFGSSSTTMMEYLRLEGPHRIPGDKLTFLFKDAFNGGLSFITNASFGQTEDIKSLLVALKAICDCCWVHDKVGCNLFGQSRGAGAITNMLAVLNTKINEWDADFCDIKKIFNDENREQILMMLKKGVVVLDTPMITTHLGVKSHIHQLFNGIFGEEFVINVLHDYILPVITCGKYSPSGMQALTSVSKLPQDLKLLVSFQNNDEAVGNVLDKAFSEQLSLHLNSQNVWVVLGNDEGKDIDHETLQVLQTADREEKIQTKWWRGGVICPIITAHRAGFITLLQNGVLNAFFKRHQCSYYEDSSKLRKGAEVLEKAHRVENFERHFKNYDMNYGPGRTDSSI